MNSRFFTLFSLVIILFGFTSCEYGNVVRLKWTIKVINDQCPVELGTVGDLLGVRYDEKTGEVQMHFSVSEDVISINARKKDDTWRQASKMSSLLFLSQDSTGKQFLEQIVQTGADLSYTIEGASTGALYVVAYTSDELKAALANPMSEAEFNQMRLEYLLVQENALCPHEVDYGVTAVRVIDDGYNIVYCYCVDEGVIDMSDLEYAMADIKLDMQKSFRNETGLVFYISLGRGLGYRYYGDTSGKTVDITFSIDELEDMLR